MEVGAKVVTHRRGGLLVDFIDIVKDPVPPNEYKTEEDPKLFHSTKTQRGPLSENWIEEHRQQAFPIMCAYKLCKVEFRYWGMQSKIERFIHDTGEGARLSLCPSIRLPPPPPPPRLPGAPSFCYPRAHVQRPTWFPLTTQTLVEHLPKTGSVCPAPDTLDQLEFLTCGAHPHGV